MKNNYGPIRELKLADRPSPPPDPAVAAIEHMDELRAHADELAHLLSLLTRWGNDPVGVFRLVQARLVEESDRAGRLVDSGAALVQAKRLAGDLSAAYATDDLGVQGGS